MDSLSFRFDAITNDKNRKVWEAILFGRIVVLVKFGIEVLRSEPRSELAQAFGNGSNVEFLLGRLLPSNLHTLLDEQLRRIHVLMLLCTLACIRLQRSCVADISGAIMTDS